MGGWGGGCDETGYLFTLVLCIHVLVMCVAVVKCIIVGVYYCIKINEAQSLL